MSETVKIIREEVVTVIITAKFVFFVVFVTIIKIETQMKSKVNCVLTKGFSLIRSFSLNMCFREKKLLHVGVCSIFFYRTEKEKNSSSSFLD